MNTQPRHRAVYRGSKTHAWLGASYAGLILSLGVMLLPTTARAHPQTRDGFFIGLGLATGSAAVDFGSGSTDRESGSGGSFRLGWTVNPKFALGLENNSWFTSSDEAVAAMGATTFAASFFPAEGLVLRGGVGLGYEGEASDGLGGAGGFAWTVGTAYEFRVTRSFAIGPQIDYTRLSLDNIDANYYNVGVSLNWYFIPK